MNCKDVINILNQLAYPDISRELMKQITAHSTQCSSCARRLSFFRDTDMLMHNEKEVKAPVFLEERLISALLHENTWQQTNELFFGKPWHKFAAAAVIILGMVLTFQLGQKLYTGNNKNSAENTLASELMLDTSNESAVTAFLLEKTNKP